MTDLVVFLGAIAVIGAAGVGVGMLVARRLDRWTAARDAAHDEERGGDDRSDPEA